MLPSYGKYLNGGEVKRKEPGRPALKRIRKIAKFWLLALLGMLMVAVIGAVTPTKWFYHQQSDCTVPIYISSVNNFHAEIIVPVSNETFDWRQQLDLQQLGQESDQYQYLSFGWGDRQFFMNAAYDPLTIFDVLFLPGPSVMHVWGHPEPQLQLGDKFALKRVNLSKAEYLRLAQFINDGFQRVANDQINYLQPGFYQNSGFYEAKGSYSIWRNCNAWTAEALRVADVNTPLWPALAPAVMKQINCDCLLE
jgi:uncharacterized protein (TIGR02117 family)